MPTKTTTKTAARKTATARKPVKAAVAPESKHKATKSAKVEAPAKPKSAPVPAPTKSKSHTEAARKSHAAVAQRSRETTAEAAKPAEPKAAKPAMETVSLIDEKKPRPKRAEGDAAPKRSSFLPPISRIRATPDATPAPPPVTPPPPPPPVEAPPAAAEPTVAEPTAEPEVEAQKIIHIKPPIIVKDLA